MGSLSLTRPEEATRGHSRPLLLGRAFFPFALCVLDEKEQIIHRSQVRGIEEMLRVLKGLPDRFEVCYEASCGYGHYHDLLQPLASRVLVAHPGRLRLISRSKGKSDRKDTERVAKLLYLTGSTKCGKTPRSLLFTAG